MQRTKGQGYYWDGKAFCRDKHDAAWWRQWWQENKSNYLADVAAIEIPDYRSPLVFALEGAGRGKKAASRGRRRRAGMDLRAGGNVKKRYFLVGALERANPPGDGYSLLIVLPGGDGSATSCLPFAGSTSTPFRDVG